MYISLVKYNYVLPLIPKELEDAELIGKNTSSMLVKNLLLCADEYRLHKISEKHIMK